MIADYAKRLFVVAKQRFFIAGVAAIAFAGTAPAASAQTAACAVSGTVTDSTGHPLPGAVVTVASGGVVVTADEDGRFCAASDPSGRVTLTASLQGFRPQQLTVSRDSGQPTVVNFRLTPEFADAVVVTGTRTGKRLDETPVRTELIDRAAIDRVSARTLADAIEFTTGVRV